MDTLLPVLAGYVLGSLPLGYLLASRFKGIDLRRVGSGNVGAANAYRTAGLAMAVLVVFVDLTKGASSVMLAARMTTGSATAVTAGVAAIVGHMYPVWLRFHGGKGVATACGVFVMLAPLATAISGLIFLVAVSFTRYVSIGSVIAAGSLPLLAWITNQPAPVIAGSVVAALLIVERHRGNLVRLQHGTERRLGERHGAAGV